MRGGGGGGWLAWVGALSLYSGDSQPIGTVEEHNGSPLEHTQKDDSKTIDQTPQLHVPTRSQSHMHTCIHGAAEKGFSEWKVEANRTTNKESGRERTPFRTKGTVAQPGWRSTLPTGAGGGRG